jgi:hypothetical protein
MATTVQFDRKLCGRTIEIQEVTVHWMLATKLVASKIPVS